MQYHTYLNRSMPSSYYAFDPYFDSLENNTNFTFNFNWFNESVISDRAFLITNQTKVITFNKSENFLHSFVDGSGGRDLH